MSHFFSLRVSVHFYADLEAEVETLRSELTLKCVDLNFAKGTTGDSLAEIASLEEQIALLSRPSKKEAHLEEENKALRLRVTRLDDALNAYDTRTRLSQENLAKMKERNERVIMSSEETMLRMGIALEEEGEDYKRIVRAKEIVTRSLNSAQGSIRSLEKSLQGAENQLMAWEEKNLRFASLMDKLMSIERVRVSGKKYLLSHLTLSLSRSQPC